MSRGFWRCVCIVTVLLGDLARAQPPEVQEALERTREAYRVGRIADEFEVEVRRAGEVERSGGTIRLNVRARRGPAVRLDLNELSIAATPQKDGFRIRGIHERDPERVYAARGEGELSVGALQQRLPPLAIPQLWLALGGGDESVTPLAPSIRWLDVVREREGGLDLRVLVGRSGQRPVKLGIDATTHRVRQFSVRLSDESDRPLIRVLSRPADEDGRDMAIDAEGRQPVASLAALSPGPRPIRAGEAVPALPLMSRDGSPWSIERALARLEDDLESAGGRPPGLLVLVAARGAARAGGLLEAVQAAEAAARRAREETGEGRAMPVVRTVGVVCYEVEAFSRERVTRDAGAWRERAGSVPLVWTTAPNRVIGSFVPDASVAGILIDSDGRLVEAVGLGAGDSDEGERAPGSVEPLERAILEAIAGRGAREAPRPGEAAPDGGG